MVPIDWTKKEVSMSSNEEAKTEVKIPTMITVDMGSQKMVAKDNSELVRLIRTFMKGMAFPKSLDNEEKILSAWQLAASLNVPPIRGIQNIAFVNGTMTLWGELPLALARATGELSKFQVCMVDKDQVPISLANKNLNQEPWGAVVSIERKSQGVNEYTYTMKDAERAGLDKKPGPWRDHRPIMLLRRAIAKAVKFEFADALMGAPVAEYDFDTGPDLKDVTPSSDLAKQINEEYLEKSE